VLLQAIAGPDPLDPTALQAPVPPYARLAGEPAQGLRIGIDADWNGDGADAQTLAMTAAAAQVFQELGATLVPLRFPAAGAEQASVKALQLYPQDRL
ncbi:hypothetical protein CW367_21615, partial [Bacillus subtilis]|uniref:amidase family protein n=1 Tax=Bacillus subtilis TaxID=1423 RepID=UPI00202AB967